MLTAPHAEWLETAGTGAFAMGSVSRVRTRRYHALLMHAASPSSCRRVLVPGYDAWIESGGRRYPLTLQRYAGAPISAGDALATSAFEFRPWPARSCELLGGSWHQEIFISSRTGETIVRWEAIDLPDDSTLCLRPFLACRDYHALQQRDPAFRMDPERAGSWLVWSPYPGQPQAAILTNGEYRHEPYWYERFEYEEERRRGFDFVEDLASPGVITWEIGPERAAPVMILRSLPAGSPAPADVPDAAAHAAGLAQFEETRRSEMDPLDFAASQYLARRGDGASIIAGYPWFTDWGRDTFIAMRGLLTARERFDEAREVVETWAATLKDGLLPNLFVDDRPADYAAADTALWFIVASAELCAAMRAARLGHRAFEKLVRETSDAILTNFISGTTYGIRADDDGLLAAGEPGSALTWMDARVNGVPVTPRVGKPVELQCLWVNALEFARRRSAEFRAVAKTARRSFVSRFWMPELGHLADVVDVNHARGTVDASLRPNQIFAVGGLPRGLVRKEMAGRILDVVTRELYTPMGLRTLAPTDPAYRGRYSGGPDERDSAYHQGTAWPWLMGPYAEAWLRVNGDSTANRIWIRQHCVERLRANMLVAGLGHVAEVADGNAPHTPGGCPFQAWSLGEFIRIDRMSAVSGLSGRRLYAVA